MTEMNCPKCGADSTGPFGNVKDCTTSPPTERCISFDYACGSFVMDEQYHQSDKCRIQKLSLTIAHQDTQRRELEAALAKELGIKASLQRCLCEFENKLAKSEAENARLRIAVEKYLCAKSHDLCHENRQELALAFGLPNDCERGLPPEQEFAIRCIEYRKQLYGSDGPGSDEEVYLDEIKRLRAELADCQDRLRHVVPVGRLLDPDIAIAEDDL